MQTQSSDAASSSESILEIARKVKLAAAQLPLFTGAVRTEALHLIADRLEKKKARHFGS